MQKNLSNFEFIGTHPLFGPDSIKNGLAGKKIIVCDGNATKAKRVFWNKYWRSRGLQVIELTAQEHDRQAAYSQGLAHFIGRILSTLEIKNGDVTTKGSSDLVDIISQTSNDTWQLFDDLQHYNPYTKQMRDDFEKAHDAIRRRLDKLINNKF